MEQRMATQSLARIMYGTSEDFHVTAAANFTAPSTLPAQTVAERSDRSTIDGETLGELLHRVWTNLSHKR